MTFRKSKFWSLLLAHLFFLAALGIHPVVMPPTADAATQSILPYPRFKAFVTGTSDPLAGGKLYTYLPGTTTPTNTYTTSAGTVANANPVVLDANGEADVWFTGTIKLVLTDSDNVTVWTKDNVGAVGSYGSLTGDSTGNISGFDNGTFTGRVTTGDLITEGPWVDVRAYGTITFGSSPSTAQKTANVAAIKAAHDNLVLTYGGGRVVFPAKKIMINAAIDNLSSYVTFEGQKGGYLLKGTEISGEGATPATLFNFGTNATDRVKFKDMVLSNAPDGITIPNAIYTSNLSLEDVGFINISDAAINVADNTDYWTGGIARGTFTRVNFYNTKYGFYSNDRAMVNNLLFNDCYWGNPIDNGIGIRAGDGTYFTVRGGLNNGTPTTTHVPISTGYGTAYIDGLEFADYGSTPGTNDNVPLFQVRKSADASLTKNLSLIVSNSASLTNFRGPIIAIDPLAKIYTIGIHNSHIDAASGHTTAMDNQVITNAGVIDHLVVTGTLYNGSAQQANSVTATWVGNTTGYPQFLPANVPKVSGGDIVITDNASRDQLESEKNLIFRFTGTGNLTFTVNPASYVPAGTFVIIQKVDSGGSVTINRNLSDTLEGVTSLYLRRAGESIKLISDGVSAWYSPTRITTSNATASVTDNSTIAHGMGFAPSVVTVTGSVAGEIVSVTSIDTTYITVAIKKHDGTAGTSQTVYWTAWK
ncbi:MAG: hypothetical protein M1377_03390 [Deltaproteobacteria bacterium]|nr:hypothetical protein [Deltaproteobacteria bacterium]